MKLHAICWLFALCIVGNFSLAAEEDRPVEDASKFKLQNKADPNLPTLFLVGDSTMKVGTKGQRGWGEEMAQFFDPKQINVVNDAIGGRSSRTFQTEGRWDAVVQQINKGDFVIVQFGHNDASPVNEKPPVTASTRARGTIKGIGDETEEVDNILTQKHEVVHTYGWYMKKYVEDTKARGGIPIVFSLTARRDPNSGKSVRSGDNSYGAWSKQVAALEGVMFVDHNEIIAQALDKLGPENTAPMFGDGKLHASPEGALLNAKMAVSGLKALEGHPLDKYLSDAGKAIEPFVAAKN